MRFSCGSSSVIPLSWLEGCLSLNGLSWVVEPFLPFSFISLSHRIYTSFQNTTITDKKTFNLLFFPPLNKTNYIASFVPVFTFIIPENSSSPFFLSLWPSDLLFLLFQVGELFSYQHSCCMFNCYMHARWKSGKKLSLI